MASFIITKKNIFFSFFLIPFILHGYAMNLSLLYWNNMILLSLLVFILIFFVYKINININNEEIIFIFYLISISLPLIFYQVNTLYDIIKYTVYFFVYSIVFKRNLNITYFNIFINLIIVYIIFSFTLYSFDLILNFNFYSDFSVSQMVRDHSIPSNLKIASKPELHYFPFYLYIIPDFLSSGLINYNLLGLPRFYGFSHEPTAFATVILPLIYICIDIGRKYAAIFLSIMLIIISSYYSLLLFIILTPFLVRPKKRTTVIIYFSIMILFFTIYADDLFKFFVESEFTQRRYLNYLAKLDYSYSFQIVSSSLLTEINYQSASGVFIGQTMRYGIISLLAYSTWLIYHLKKAMNYYSLNDIIIFISILFMTFKGAYYFEPLTLFYYSYVTGIKKY